MLIFFQIKKGEAMELKTANKDFVKGLLLILVGVALLLHTLGAFQAILNYMLIAISITLIVYGVFKAKLIEVLSNMIDHRKK